MSKRSNESDAEYKARKKAKKERKPTKERKPKPDRKDRKNKKGRTESEGKSGDEEEVVTSECRKPLSALNFYKASSWDSVLVADVLDR